MSTSSRFTRSIRLRLALLALGAGFAVSSCNEQRILTGFERDIVTPIVSITKTQGDTMDVQDGLQFSVSAADNLGLKTISVSLTGGLTLQIDTTFHTAVLSTTLPINITFPKNTTIGGKVYIRATATDGSNNSVAVQDSVFLTNKDALIVTLVRPTSGLFTSAGKQMTIVVNAHQSKGITKIGWIVAGVVTGADSMLYGAPLDTTSIGPTFQDTITIPSSAPPGVFTVTGFAEDANFRRVLTIPTPVTIQLNVNDSTPPLVTISVGQRVEVHDAITVTATDQAGITLVGWTAVDKGSGAVIGGDSIASSGAQTDVVEKFDLNLVGVTTFPKDVIITGFAVDGASPPNRGFSRATLSPTALLIKDTVTVVNGVTKPLPQGGRIQDAVYNRNLNEIYMTNTNNSGQGVVEIFSLVDTSFKAPIFVGSRPWGIALWPRDTLGANGDTVVVANSGGANLSVVDLVARRQVRRHELPNFLIQTVQTKLSPGTNVINLEITEYDFSDRPEFLGMTCRPLGGTACPPNRIYAVYSTFPTQGQSGIFGMRGSMRWENMNPAMNESHFFWEQASVSASTSADTLQVIIDRAGTQTIDLSAACGVIIDLKELAFLDTTFVRTSGNFTHALVGEGGSGTAPLSFARAIGYNAITGMTNSFCSGYIRAGGDSVLFSGPGNIDNGVTDGVQVRDFIANTAIPVQSVATNFNGRTNLIRADRVYVLNEALRLEGIMSVTGENSGMDLNFDHRFDAGCGGTVGSTGVLCGPNGLNKDDRIVFVARADGNIDVIDTFFYGTVATIPIRDPVIGPLRAARLPLTGEWLLMGVTASGIVTVRLPPIANLYQAPQQWGAPTASHP